MSGATEQVQPCTVIVFGASGDLTQRKLVPALHSLDCAGLLPDGLCILGVARTELSDDEFCDRLRDGVRQFGRLDPEVWEPFAARLVYMPGRYDDPQTYRRLKEHLGESSAAHANRLFYLAVPPEVYPIIIRQIGEAGLDHSEGGWTRIVIEKPFGHDLESARHLNEKIHASFREDQVYRIDHYLGKETVQNILAFRFANFIFQEIWGRNFVDHVQITAVEQVGVEHRGGYYDQAGVVRDMLQSHLLQLVSLTAMEPPTTFSDRALRNEKVKVLEAVQPLSLKDGVLGQYRGYRQEPAIAPDSRTPTFAALKLYVNNWRWQGVPFYLRTGKSLARKTTEIVLQFKQVPHRIFAGQGEGLSANRLSLCIQPDEGMHLRFELKVPGLGMKTAPVDMDFHYAEPFGDKALPDAYERLLLDALQGDASLFARNDEIERAWELVTPLLEQWEGAESPPLALYDSESWGPDEAEELIRKDGRAWLSNCWHDPAAQ
jgi:glucose-6-phosphate 1-dehydrogenase